MHRYAGSLVALAILVLGPLAAGAGGQDAAAPRTVGGCPGEPAAFHACALAKAKAFTPPRTPSGKPNLQGYWDSRLAMPFSVEGVPESEPMVRDLVMPWVASPPMVVDTPDRKIPYQPWAVPIGRRGENFLKYIDPRTECASAGVPRLALQDPSQIIQPWGDDHVLWLFEDHHVPRVITMDGRPPIGDSIKLWNGSSRGRWEGNTLVIDITNVNGYTWFDDSGDFYTDTAHLVERLTMFAPDTIHYQVTLEDPKVYTRPWTMVWALVRQTEPGFEIMEEACREGERDLPRIREQGYRPFFGETWRGR
ncbi:MAG: hypothetical protein EXQ53_06940 [Acidobacteria bacterium]|nr:hypothetical protein [Acidobacteriota bacterium]